MIRVLLHKRTITIVAGIAIICYIIGWIIAGQSVHCGPVRAGGQNCAAATSGAVGSGVAFFIAWVLTVVSWAMALLKTYRVRSWVWLVLCFIFPPVFPFLYGLFGRETPVNNRPTYVEGSPPTPVMP